MPKCPVCREQRVVPDVNTGEPVEEPLYQTSYPGSKEYISPRCSVCFDKMMDKRNKKKGGDKCIE